jgi:NAD(P)-dependent dehydrogenase (short-subunit alcohol dehydrogenase family)
MDMGITGRSAIVTGGSRGIGRETARQLAERGYDVVVTARDEAKAREAAEALGGRPLRLDVSDPASIERAAAAVRADPGALDVLVNNAGVGSDFGIAGAEPRLGRDPACARHQLLRRLPAHDRAAAAAARERARSGGERLHAAGRRPHRRFFRDGKPVAF